MRTKWMLPVLAGALAVSAMGEKVQPTKVDAFCDARGGQQTVESGLKTAEMLGRPVILVDGKDH